MHENNKISELNAILTILLPQFRNERQIYPEIPGENVSYPGKKNTPTRTDPK